MIQPFLRRTLQRVAAALSGFLVSGFPEPRPSESSDQDAREKREKDDILFWGFGIHGHW